MHSSLMNPRLLATVFTLACLTGLQAIPVFNPANGHYYELVETPLPWLAAEADAESRVYNGWHGHLATVQDQAENDFIQTLVQGVLNAFIGGYQPPGSPEPAGNWRWVTDESFSFTSWKSGEPNNLGSEDVILFDGGLGLTPGRWIDVASSGASPYVVEYDSFGSPVPDSGGTWALLGLSLSALICLRSGTFKLAS